MKEIVDKMIWILFISNTLLLLSLIEILFVGFPFGTLFLVIFGWRVLEKLKVK